MINLNCFRERLAAVLAGVLLVTAYSASAQEEEVADNYIPYPHAFIGIQAGGQTTFTDYDNLKLITPTTSIGVGVHFTPIIGARLHVNGFWNKGGVCNDYVNAKYKYKYTTADLDVMINLVNLIAKGNYHPLNVYLIGGAGFNYAWDNEDVPALRNYISTVDSRNRMTHNYRVGTMFDVRVAPNWSVNLEVAGNCLGDRFNSKISNSADWQLTAQVGLTYKFGKARKVKGSRKEVDTGGNLNTKDTDNEAVSADLGKDISKQEKKPEVVKTAVVPEKPEPKDIRREIFFALRGTEVSPTEQPKLEQVAEWLKSHPSAKVVVTGYADKDTGTPTINARYAKQRANTVAKELTTKYGIAANRITTDSKGDTVQPFAENDKNRVSVIIATSSEDANEKTR